MPIIVGRTPLNAISEGLLKGCTQGKELQAQQAAIDDAKKRREQEQQRIEMAKSAQDLNQSLAKSEEAFAVEQRAYKTKVQGQEQDDRARLCLLYTSPSPRDS